MPRCMAGNTMQRRRYYIAVHLQTARNHNTCKHVLHDAFLCSILQCAAEVTQFAVPVHDAAQGGCIARAQALDRVTSFI